MITSSQKQGTCNDRSCCWPNDTADDVLSHIYKSKKGRIRVPFCYVADFSHKTRLQIQRISKFDYFLKTVCFRPFITNA